MEVRVILIMLCVDVIFDVMVFVSLDRWFSMVGCCGGWYRLLLMVS